MNKIQDYDLVETDDKSFTIYDKNYGDSMHTSSGAYGESLIKHINASGIIDTGKKEVFVLDVGTGLGYNILALLDSMLKKRPEVFVNIVSLEKTDSYFPLMKSIFFNDEKDQLYDSVKKAFENKSISTPNYSITIILGDARSTIKAIANRGFDAVFHDPYTHYKNPELWSLEFFREEYGLINESGILTTYSSAPQVRAGLLEARFFIGRGPVFGNKRGATIAAKNMVIESLDDIEIGELKKNRQSVPYRDLYLNDTREHIIERWKKEMLSREHHQAHQG